MIHPQIQYKLAIMEFFSISLPIGSYKQQKFLDIEEKYHRTSGKNYSLCFTIFLVIWYGKYGLWPILRSYLKDTS